MEKILIIDDEPEIQRLLKDSFSQKYETASATSISEGRTKAIKEKPDLIVLDLHLPDGDGMQLCEELRTNSATRGIPIIMLTSEVEVGSKVKGLGAGADDYVGKPFNVRELQARVEARLRSWEEKSVYKVITMGNLRLNPKSREALVDGAPLPLTQIEFDLLEYFVKHPNEVISRGKILKDLWAGTVVSERTVDTHMANLRKKLKDFSLPLETVYKVGYILKNED